MKVYLVNRICDYEYGCREVVAVFSSRKSAKDYISKQPQKCGANTAFCNNECNYNPENAKDYFERIAK